MSGYAQNSVKECVKMIQQFALNFDRTLEGSRSTEVNTMELSGGAKINCLFHERFPFEIVKMEFDETDLRKEIAIAICNIHGIRMTRFPRLRETVESIVTSYIRRREQACKDQLSLYIDCQLSYMNTNHEDFIGFANAENQARKIASGQAKSLGNQVIRKGFMCLHNLSIIKGRDFWFVLTSESLSWYKDSEEKEIQYILPLTNLKLRDMETGFMSRRHMFALFYPNGSNIYKDYKQLELSCDTLDEVDYWKASFLRAGVYPERKIKAEGDEQEDEDNNNVLEETVDPTLKRQVEVIRNLVDSYLSIVTKSTKDLVPKTITHMLICDTKNYIYEELLIHVYANEDQASLMEESAEEVKKREEKMAMYQACRTALEIIGDCSMRISTSKSNNKMIQKEDDMVSLLAPTPAPSAATKRGFRLSTPPPTVSRPAPPPPQGTAPSLPEWPH